MRRTSILLTAVWFAFSPAGFSGNTTSSFVLAGEGHGHAMPHGTASMHHEKLEVGDAPNPPAVALTIHKDPKAGWNLQVRVDNFRFAPEHASTTHVPGEGHAHLFIDGKKITRLYGEWYHIPTLGPGVHKITVTLNANSHEDLVVKGRLVSATQEIRVPAK